MTTRPNVRRDVLPTGRLSAAPGEGIGPILVSRDRVQPLTDPPRRAARFGGRACAPEIVHLSNRDSGRTPWVARCSAGD